jgi:hypothetical protein
MPSNQRQLFARTDHVNTIVLECPKVSLRDGVLYVRVLQPALDYELEQISKPQILRKRKQRFGAKTIRDVRFRLG